MTCPNTKTCGSMMEKIELLEDLFVADDNKGTWEVYGEITEIWECPNCGERLYRGDQ